MEQDKELIFENIEQLAGFLSGFNFKDKHPEHALDWLRQHAEPFFKQPKQPPYVDAEEDYQSLCSMVTGENSYSEQEALDMIQNLYNASLSPKAVDVEKIRKDILRELDTDGGDYLTARKAVAELSGVPTMAITFNEHLEIISKKLTQPPKQKGNDHE